MARTQTVATNLRIDPMAEREMLSTQAERCQTPWACFAHPTESPTSPFLSHPVTQKDLLIRMSLPHRLPASVLQIRSSILATSAPIVRPACTPHRANGSTGSRAYRSTPKSLFFFSFISLTSMPPLLLAYLCTIVCLGPDLLICDPSHVLGLILTVKDSL
jgi:hypothetical protein